MSGIREDYIQRMIEQLVAALAAILKAGQTQRPDDALELIRQTSLSLFGLEYRMLITIDAVSVAGLLGQPEKIVGLAKLVSAEADLLERQGDREGARHRLRHVEGLLRACPRAGPATQGELETLLASVKDRLDREPSDG